MDPSRLSSAVFLSDAIWQSSAWLIAGLAASILMSRRPARAHGVLLLSLAAAAITPLLAALLRLLGWGLMEPVGAAISGGALAPQRLMLDGGLFQESGLLSGRLLAAGWLVLSLVAVARLLLSVRRGRHLLSAAGGAHDGPASRLVRDAAVRLRLWQVPEICVLSGLRCPVIWCWGPRPRLVLPRALAEERAEALQAVICHELAHFKRRDHLASLIGELVVCLLPWHPLAWLANRRLRDSSEQACDAWVLACGAAPTTYAESLLRLIPQPAWRLAPAAVNGRGAMTRRIARILSRGTGDPRSGRWWMIAATVATTLLAATAALAHRRPDVTDPAASPRVSAPIFAQGASPTASRRSEADVVVIPHELDLGVGEPGLPKTERAWLLNRGGRPARLLGVETSCGCTTVAGFEPGVLRPGEAMAVEITMTAPNRPGAEKTKYVTFRIKERPPLKLAVRLQAAGRD